MAWGYNVDTLKTFNPLKHIKKFKKSAQILNEYTFYDYITRLENIAINMFSWENVPDTIDTRFLEVVLCEYGYALYFDDEIMGNLALTCSIGPPLNVYRIPTERRAYASNGYNKWRTDKDSVLIYNNYLHTPTMLTLELFARRLQEIERTIDVNVKAQKTPVIMRCEEQERLTYLNLYKQYDGNEPIIMGSKNLDLNNFNIFNERPDFISLQLNTLKHEIWNEALTFLGVAATTSQKKERLISNEVMADLGDVAAERYIMLDARREAADKINKMFGTNIEVNFRQDFADINLDMPTTNNESIDITPEEGEENG